MTTKTESYYIPNLTHSIQIEDKRRGHNSELFVSSFTEAAAEIDRFHQWARENDYKPTDYTLTLTEVAR